MSKAVFICFRDREQSRFSSRDIEILSQRLTPDNISPNPPLIINENGVLIGIFNPAESIPVRNTSVCMGNLIEPEENWWQPMASIPDGTYALFRGDKRTVELATDIVASRTIWYVQTEDMLIASTSQRAIVFFLRDFKPNRTAFSWMLSSGTLGPGLSWDSRIRCLGANSRLVLDRSSWKLTVSEGTARFDPLDLSDEQHEVQLSKALEHVFEHLKLDYSQPVLPLSGGYDSRAILLMLKNRENLRCITWGLRSSLSERGNDAYIARLLADRMNVEHMYLETDVSDEPIEKIFNRFLVAGEGRIDHISGYMDGFKIWKYLFEQGYSGVIRSDEGFGWAPVNTPFDVLRSVGINLFSHYSNLRSLDEFGLKKQVLPGNLERKANESLAAWRDRLYHEFRIPVFLAALSDLKCAYVELINPFLSRSIIEQVRKMPDHLRTGKSLFKKIVRSLNPNIGFARYPAIASQGNVLRTKEAVNLISHELKTDHARGLLPDGFVQYLLERIRVSDGLRHRRRSLRERIQALIPAGIRNMLRRTFFKPRIDHNLLAFRAYIICRMNRILSEDADCLNVSR